LPDISKINNVAVADISKLDSITFAHGMKVNNQDVSLATDAHTLISTHDIAVLGASASIDITSGIDDTYDAYEFRFTNMHPASNNVHFVFQANAIEADSTQLTGFNEAMTTTWFWAGHTEDDSSTFLQYGTGFDQATTDGNGTYQDLAVDVGNGNDESASGILTLYAPSDTTYVKHFMSRTNSYHSADYSIDNYAAGYINTTNAINQISFKFDSGNTDAGVIKMYGIAKA
jgi:hypothetical protein